MPTFKLDTRQFDAAMRRLRAATRQDARRTVRDQTRIGVKEAVRLTPPFAGAAFTESFAVQKRAGENAVKSDFARIFQPLVELRIISDPEKVALAETLKKFARQKKTRDIEQILRDLGFQDPEVVIEAQASRLVAARNRRGRVRKSAKQAIVLRRQTANRLRRNLLSRVGQAKAGWPIRQAGVRGIPRWIMRHNSRSLWRDRSNDPKSPAITFGNMVGYIQDTGAQLRIMQTVIRRRTAQMRRQTERMLKKNARRANR